MRYQVVEDSYVAFHGADEDELFDEQEEELNVNWCVLIARVTAIFILVCVVVSFSLGKLDKRLFKLGAILFVACALCLACSFFECCQRRFFRSTYRQSTHPAAPSVSEYPRGYSNQGIGPGSSNDSKEYGYGQASGLPVYYMDGQSPGKIIT